MATSVGAGVGAGAARREAVLRLATQRGLGYKPDAAWREGVRRVLGARYCRARLAGDGGLLNPERVIDPLPAWVLNQGAMGSCFGHFAAGARYELGAGKGSPAHAWAIGRLASGQRPSNLHDDGVSLSAIMRACARHGVADYDAWRPGVRGFDWHALPPRVVRESAQRANFDLVEVPWGFDRAPLLVDGIARGYVPGYVIEVDRAYGLATDNVLGPARGEIRGLHIVVGRREFWRDADGAPVFPTVSSWGRDHGHDGIVFFGSSLVETCPRVYLVRGYS